MSTQELEALELSAEEMAELKRLAAIPADDLPALVAAANLSASEFAEFVREMGFQEDATCAQIANLLQRPASRDTVQDRVYAVLRERLMCGDFDPGQKLKIAELATALGTSAMPVREALNRLVEERALESAPTRTVRVPVASRESMRDLMEARIALEGLAVSRAASNMDSATLAKLHYIAASRSEVSYIRASRDSIALKRDFHFTLYRRAGSAVLLPIIESLWLQFGSYQRLVVERSRFYTEMVAALIAGDAEGARQGLESELSRAQEVLMANDLEQPVANHELRRPSHRPNKRKFL